MSAFIADSLERGLFIEAVRDQVRSFQPLTLWLQMKAVGYGLAAYAPGARVVEFDLANGQINRISVYHPRFGLLVIDIDAEAAQP